MYTDKITMHFSLECRVPILDNDLIAYIELLDKKYKFNSKGGKIIHKAFAKEYLPSSIIERKKLGFQSPADYWFRKYAEQLKAELSNGVEFNKIFQKDQVKKLIDAHVAGKNLEKTNLFTPKHLLSYRECGELRYIIMHLRLNLTLFKKNIK